MNCSYCGSAEKKYYGQIRADGVKVVAQRCGECNQSIKGQPFVSIAGFDWYDLPRANDGYPTPARPTQTQLPSVSEAPKVQRPPKRYPIGSVNYKPLDLPK
jgi:hypothetical protein